MINKKVLVFWLGFQWKKYVEYFNNAWFSIDWVTKTWINKKKVSNVINLYKFWEISNDLNLYDYHIVAVNPYKEQLKVIEFLLKSNIKWKIIIEKPVSYDIWFLEKLYLSDNIYYFLDELILSKIYKKIFYNKNSAINIVSMKDSDTIEHILSGYLLLDDFQSIINRVEFNFTNNSPIDKINYFVKSNKIDLENKKWIIKLNWKEVFLINFDNSINYILNLKIDELRLYKKNFILLRDYLNKLNLN